MSKNEEILDSNEEGNGFDRLKAKEESFIELKKYRSSLHAEEVQNLLISNGVEAKTDSNVVTVDVTFASNTHNDQYEVYVKAIDFDEAKVILELENKKLLAEVDRDHYLFQFSDEELYGILRKSDEWGDFDYILALHILEGRGLGVNDSEREALKSERIEELSRPAKSFTFWRLLGFVSVLFGGVLAIIIGYSLWRSTKTLPDGTIVYSCSDSDRSQGKIIFILGIIMLIPSILFGWYSGGNFGLFYRL